MKLTDFSALTFDCYGTLIDWESGIWTALQPLIQNNDHKVSREAALKLFGVIESEQEHKTPGLVYRDLLTKVHARIAKAWGLTTTDTLDAAFGRSVPAWPAFPDSAEALAYLKQHYKLVIVSNVDRQSFAGSNVKLGVEFDAIFTADEIGSYKPDPRNFDFMIKKLAGMGIAKDKILHTAQSLFHDHVPAEKAGLARCWINRRGDKGKGSGATKSVTKKPKLNFEFPSMAALVEAHKKS